MRQEKALRTNVSVLYSGNSEVYNDSSFESYGIANLPTPFRQAALISAVVLAVIGIPILRVIGIAANLLHGSGRLIVKLTFGDRLTSGSDTNLRGVPENLVRAVVVIGRVFIDLIIGFSKTLYNSFGCPYDTVNNGAYDLNEGNVLEYAFVTDIE